MGFQKWPNFMWLHYCTVLESTRFGGEIIQCIVSSKTNIPATSQFWKPFLVAGLLLSFDYPFDFLNDWPARNPAGAQFTVEWCSNHLKIMAPMMPNRRVLSFESWLKTVVLVSISNNKMASVCGELFVSRDLVQRLCDKNIFCSPPKSTSWA